MPAIRPLYQDPFVPLLFESEALDVTPEQQQYIKKILDKSSSDSRFADKAFLSIMYVLTHGTTKMPELTSLTPNTTVIGSPTFDLHVQGKNFGQGSTIVFNGFDEPTTVVSDSELTTGVNMDVWAAAVTVPVHVRNADGILSDPLMFEFTDAASGTRSTGQKHLDKSQTEKTQRHAEVGASVKETEKPSVSVSVTKSVDEKK